MEVCVDLLIGFIIIIIIIITIIIVVVYHLSSFAETS